MPSVGLVGGLGPESTIDYYRRIIQLWREDSPKSAPSIMIDSLDVDLGIRLVQTDRPGLAAYLLESIDRLARAGADFVAMAANTPHVVFDDLVARSTVPLLSIVEVCADEASRRELQIVGLLGTRFTMEAPLYPLVFARRSIEVAVPEEADRSWLHERYINELLRGDFREETRNGVLEIVRKLRDRIKVEGIVLGGTELPLLLKTETIEGLPTLDTTELHVRAIVQRLRFMATHEASSAT
ncbi:MAG: amino acid racemase [Gemmatimonadota bacterium]